MSEAQSFPLLIEVGEPIVVRKLAPGFLHYMIRGWAGPRHKWCWWKGEGGRGEPRMFGNKENARIEAQKISETRNWNPVLIIPFEYKGEQDEKT